MARAPSVRPCVLLNATPPAATIRRKDRTLPEAPRPPPVIPTQEESVHSSGACVRVARGFSPGLSQLALAGPEDGFLAGARNDGLGGRAAARHGARVSAFQPRLTRAARGFYTLRVAPAPVRRIGLSFAFRTQAPGQMTVDRGH